MPTVSLDSASISYVGAFLSAVDPSSHLVLLILGVMILFPLGVLIRNSKFVEAIIKYFETHNAMATTITEIRDGQIQSNLERAEQAKSIERLDSRINTLNFDLISLSREVARLRSGKDGTC